MQATQEKKSRLALFSERHSVTIRALFVAERLDLRALTKDQRIGSSPFVVEAGHEGYAVIFKYGVVVLFGLNAVEEAAFLQNLKMFATNPFDKYETENVDVVLDPDKPDGVDLDYIHIKEWDLDRLQTLADVFSKSAVLSYYEARMAGVFDRIEPIADLLQHGGPKERQARDLLRHIGNTLSIQRKMVGQVEIGEKPDLLWDSPAMERLYVRLESEYELNERHRALKDKLDMVYRTAETMLGMLQDKRTLRVEWYIVILIIIDIVISMVEKAFGI